MSLDASLIHNNESHYSIKLVDLDLPSSLPGRQYFHSVQLTSAARGQEYIHQEPVRPNTNSFIISFEILSLELYITKKMCQDHKRNKIVFNCSL